MAKAKKPIKQKPQTKASRLAEQQERIRLKQVAKDAAHLRQIAYHEAAHHVVAETLKRGEVLTHLQANYQGGRLNVVGERIMPEAQAPSLPMLISSVGWAGILSLPFTDYNIQTIEDWYAVQNNHSKKNMTDLASDDSEILAGALKSSAVKSHASLEDIELAKAFEDHAKSVMYAVWVLVQSRAKLRRVANQLIATGATFSKYKANEWEKLVRTEVIETALAMKPARL